jgi:ankyrin repeat protein
VDASCTSQSPCTADSASCTHRFASQRACLQISGIAKSPLHCCLQDNRTPLHAAVLTGNPAVVRELIHHGAAVEAVDAYGNSVLHLACEQGSLAVVKELLANPERRGVVNSKNMEGITPLHVAAQVGMRDVVMALVECGARADVKDKVQP